MKKEQKGLFIASTGQHVGKTTTALGIFALLKQIYPRIGFMKPVGQQHVLLESAVRVDKDVALFKDHFDIDVAPTLMSPVLFSKGFTRDYLDGKALCCELEKDIQNAFAKQSDNDVILVEGTGHMGVGSIAHLNNAKVASMLALPVIIVVSGGLGSAFDSIALNYALCREHGVRPKGVILNRVLPEKRDMVLHYMQKALDRWKIPILGSIPYDPFLSYPTILDLSHLLSSALIAGEEHMLRHFHHTRLLATLPTNADRVFKTKQLVITSAANEEIILQFLNNHLREHLQSGLILTGETPPKPDLIQKLKQAHLPTLYTPSHSFKVMQKISSYTAKIEKEDTEKIQEAIQLVKKHISREKLLSLLG